MKEKYFWLTLMGIFCLYAFIYDNDENLVEKPYSLSPVIVFELKERSYGVFARIEYNEKHGVWFVKVTNWKEQREDKFYSKKDAIAWAIKTHKRRWGK